MQVSIMIIAKMKLTEIQKTQMNEVVNADMSNFLTYIAGWN